MASTNKTSNYNLSQFVGTDKPAWLADYNSDMSKIDTGMKNNADAVSVTDGKADTNATNIGNLANLNTQSKTNLVASINEVYTTAGTADGTAQAAATTANSAKTEADALSRYLSITDNGQITPTVSGGTIGNINNLYYALNADGTLGKIYGKLRVNVTTTGTVTITLPIPPLAAKEQFNIACAATYTVTGGGQWLQIGARDITVNTNRTVTIEFTGIGVNNSLTIFLTPCLYFFTDFGDIVTPDA